MILPGLQLATLLLALGATPSLGGTKAREARKGERMTTIPGSRAAIDSALDRIYPTEKDFRFGLSPGPGETEAPLAEVVVYRSSKPISHWHYVTYGLTELDQKTSPDPKLSGFGVEYTIRLVDPSEQPPAWPINLLRWLARRVWETGFPYDPEHSMNLPDHMLEQVSKGVQGLAFYDDEALRTIDTPSGRITFVNVIPLMAGEYALIGSWDAIKVAAEIRALQNDLLWRHGRKSCLEGDRREVIRAMAEKEGSSQSVDFYDLPCGPKEIVLDSVGVLVVEKFLRHRLAYGRDAKVIFGVRSTQLSPGNWQFKSGKESCEIHVPANEARNLADEISKAPDRAMITKPGGLRFRIDRSS